MADDIQGLPPGSVVTPINQQPPPQQQIQGLPPGSVVTPINGNGQQQQQAQPTTQQQPTQRLITGIPSLDRFEKWIETEGAKDPDSGRGAGILRDAVGQVGGLAKLGRMIPGAQWAYTPEENARTQQFIEAMQKVGEAQTPEEKQGQLMSGIAQWISGDEVLKGLSYADRVKEILPFMQKLEKFPRIARMIGAGIEQGTIGGATTAAKTGSPTQAVEGAVLGAGVGTVLQGGIDTTLDAGEIAKNARDLYTGEGAQRAVQQNLAQGIRNVFGGVASDRNVVLPDIPSIRDISPSLADAIRKPPPAVPTDAETEAATQNDLQKGIRGVIRDTAKDASPLKDKEGNWIQFEEPDSIRDTAKVLSDGLEGKAKAIYQRLDQALGGTRFQAFGENIRDLNNKLRSTTDPEAEDALNQALREENSRLDDAIQQLHQQGVDPDLIKEANAAFRQHTAAEELSNHLRQSTRGLRPELQQPGQESTPETVQADQLANRVNRMYDSGRLQDALGKDRAEDLLRHVDRAQVATPKTPAALRQQSDAIDEVTKKIHESAGGMKPQDVTPGRKGATPETFNINQLFNGLHDLHDDGILQEALGPQRARDLLNEVDRARNAEADAIRRTNRIRTGIQTGAKVAGTLGLGAGAAAGYRTAEHLFEGTYYRR